MNILDLQRFVVNQQALDQQNNGISQIGQMFGDEFKRRDDEERKQQNIVKQISSTQKLMATMASMPDQTSTGKAASLVDSGSGSKGVSSISTMVPVREVTIDEKGVPSLKIGYKQASPTEQKSLIDIENTKRQMQIDQQKQQFNNDFITGKIPDGAYLQEMGNLGLKIEDYQSAKQLRDQMNRVRVPVTQGTPIPSNAAMSVPEGYRIPGYEKDKFGNLVAQPPEVIPATEMKAKQDMAEAAAAKEKQSEMVRNSAQDTINTIAEVKKGINNFGAMGPIPTLNPWDYDRKNWEANVSKTLSKKIVDLMGEMKQASKTGATGFGALSQKELAVLETASTALNRGLSPADAQRYLDQIEGMARKVVGDNGQTAPMAQPIQGADIRAQYNALRASGVSAEQAKKQLGL